MSRPAWAASRPVWVEVYLDEDALTAESLGAKLIEAGEILTGHGDVSIEGTHKLVRANRTIEVARWTTVSNDDGEID